MRKTKEITIDDRGTAKTFRITEMPATKFEWWIIQAGRALLGAGLGKELPGVNINSAEDVQEKVGNLLANEGLTALNNVDLDKIKPLYDQLLECCELKIDNFYTKLDPDTVDAQIESVKTLFTLRKGFFRGRRRLPFSTLSGQAGRHYKLAKTVNISPLLSSVIINRYATLNELQTVYSYEDLLNMLECLQVDIFNQNQNQRESERELERER